MALVAYANAYEAAWDYEYGILARNLAAGRGYSYPLAGGPAVVPTAEQAPLYPFYLAFFYWAFPDSFGQLSALTVQAALGAASCATMYLIGAVAFDRRVGILAGAASCVYPPLVYYSAKLVPTTIITLLLGLVILCALGIARRPTGMDRWGFMGVLLGLLALAEPIFLPLCYPLLALWLWRMAARQLSLKRSGLLVVMSVGVAVAIVAPWTVRNYWAMGGLVPVKSPFGFTLWVGNNPNATGTTYAIPNDAAADLAYKHLPPASVGAPNDVMGFGVAPGTVLMELTLPIETFSYITSLPELQKDHAYRAMALEFMREHPGRVLALTLRKAWYFWWFPPENVMPTLSQTRYGVLRYASYVPLLVAAVPGLLLAWQYRRPTACLIGALAIGTSAVYSITIVGLGRYRTPLEYVLLVLASYAVAESWAGLLRNRHRLRTLPLGQPKGTPVGQLSGHGLAEQQT
jgi:4-amino-4-deoxy-L-arabinose transferase-like glycosyltransferase